MDSERIVNNYARTLSFSVVLFGMEPYSGKKAKAMLKQNDKVIKAYEVAIPLEAEKTFGRSDKLVFRLQCYFYFWKKEIITDKPMILSIVTGNKKKHHFYFSGADIK